MRTSFNGLVVVAALVAGLGPIAAARAADPAETVKLRQDTMKRMNGDLKTIREYGEGKGDHEKAVAAANDIVQTVPKLPDLFPKGTGMAEFPGKSGAKPEIWAEWDNFLGHDKVTEEKAKELLGKVKAADKAAAAAGPAELWDTGCQTCHKPFRAKI